MTNLVSYNFENGVATIRMDDGKANVLSPAMLDALNLAFDKAEKDEAVVVLTGREGGVFSGGFDLKVMMSGAENAIALTCQGSRFALRLLGFPYPVIAAVTGHAIAMGAFTLLACDYRVGPLEPTKTGLNETQIGMTMHHFGIELAREFIPKHYLNRSLINGEIFMPEDAARAGYFDKLVAKEAVMETAMMGANMMKLLNMRAFKGTKRKSRQALFEKLKWAISEDEKMTVLE
ncbi:MAG TPA: crotonase/enoyl-CoA hydratase family protein [Hellea balneolensis]|uniref:Crotonase/enoyl-CoA hydratase family protein n=1 Tax=Hellea balneolensis TaxID=287478 RepID=A0A7C5LZX4_9PROT|nr:crotonase/enoyl-CoA hydratase family protein [Hellea balneolensis]